MMSQPAHGLWELILWIVAGSGLLGLPPGERDGALMKAVPAQSVVYFEWAARGPGQSGAAGVDGFAADPEIVHFAQLFEAAISRQEAAAGAAADREGLLQQLRPVAPQLLKLISAHPGCVFASFDPAKQNAPGPAGILAALTSAQAGIIFSSGNDTDALWQTLNQALATVPGFQFDPQSATQSIPLSVPGYKLTLHREGQRIVMAFGETTLPRIVDGLSGRQPGLDTNPRFRQSYDRVALPRFASVGWIDGNGLITGVTSSLGPMGLLVRPILMMVGIDALDHIVQSSGVDRGTMIQRTFVSTGGRTDGIMVLAAGQAIQPEQFAHIPADADMVLATSISLSGVFQETRQILSKTQPLSVRVFDEAVKQLQSELGLKIVEDVLPAFGDVIMAFDSPGSGGMIATGLTVSLEVKDGPKAAVVYERLMKLIEQSYSSESTQGGPAPGAMLQRQAFLGQTISYFTALPTDHPGQIPMSPTFCLTDRHLLFSIHPQAMKAHLRFLQSKKPGFDQVAARKVAVPPGEPLTYAYLDGARASSGLSTFLPYLGHAVLSRLNEEGISLDAFAIPSAAAITPYLGDATAIVMRQPDGLFVETRNAPPVIVSLSMLTVYREWTKNEFELFEVRRHSRGGDGGELGAPVGDNQVVPAVAEKQPPAPPKPGAAPNNRLGSIFLKALIPENLQQMIPESALEQISKGPSPEALERREELRRKREEQRDLRRQKRMR